MLNSWPHPLPVEDLQRCTQLPLDSLPVVLAELELQGLIRWVTMESGTRPTGVDYLQVIPLRAIIGFES